MHNNNDIKRLPTESDIFSDFVYSLSRECIKINLFFIAVSSIFLVAF